ncbi:unnamed protein product [Clonostachys rosea f. rosea IK726]|uniref:Uncharacterized protein n=1 Tax=Clonostachys rosea f. rosea IK726 TaxID=1349383 RepID=A0ACA9UTI0_BIOOC|nr:unnamed protein product [Clonostachys rosea f. rosea IK726]
MSDYLHEILQLRQQLETERREKLEARAPEEAERRERGWAVTERVLIWNGLAGGNDEYCAILVAIDKYRT